MEHKRIQNDLERRLKKICNYVWTNEEYKLQGISGECDVGGIIKKWDRMFVFEVKTTDNDKNRLKAYHQLSKDESFYTKLYHDYEPFQILKFYAYGSDKRRGYDVIRVK